MRKFKVTHLQSLHSDICAAENKGVPRHIYRHAADETLRDLEGKVELVEELVECLSVECSVVDGAPSRVQLHTHLLQGELLLQKMTNVVLKFVSLNIVIHRIQTMKRLSLLTIVSIHTL